MWRIRVERRRWFEGVVAVGGLLLGQKEPEATICQGEPTLTELCWGQRVTP